ncbi:MAG TPA: PAS domain S-box protein [Pyrinomonadaceae bacterium]|jgi:PAS domain S-box-containing protein
MLEEQKQQGSLQPALVLYRQLIWEVKSHAVFVLSPEGRILSWNKGAERIKGYSADEIIGQPLSILFTDEDVALKQPQQEIAEAAATGQFIGEGWRRRKDGSRFWASFSLTALRDETGELLGFLKITRDISARQRIEEQLQHQVRITGAITSNAAEGLCMMDATGRLTFMNPAAEELLGWRREELLGRVMHDAIHHRRADGTPFPIHECPIVDVLKSGATVRNREDVMMRKDGSFVPVYYSCAPIIVDGEITGAVVALHDISERKIIEAELREQTEVVETVNNIGQLLSAELDQHKLVQAVTDAATELSGARFGSFFYNVLDERGASYMLYTLSGAPREAFEHFPMPRATDLFGPTFRGEGVIRLADVKQDARYGKNSPYYGMPSNHLPVTSYLAVPVISRSGEVLGGLFFGHPEAGVFTERTERIVTGLAAQAAIAMDNARLFEAARRAHAQSEAAERRSAFLAEASAILASSLDYETTLASVARLAVPHIADWCSVHIIEKEGAILPLAVAHVDPSKVAMAEELQRLYPIDPTEERGAAQAIRTGQSEIYADIPDSLLAQVARDEEQLAILRELGLKSAMTVPMIVQGRALGTISFISAESGRHYGPEDLTLAEDLARRAALAIDNARLYREAQEVNRIKDEFLATLSHELRTPLTAVLGWAKLLSTGQLDAEASSRALDTIQRNARAQQQIIEDILDVSRIITGKLRLEVNPVELVPVIEAAMEGVRPAADAKAIRLEPLLDAGTGLVMGDPARLQQVVWNLLSNAVKFTPQGGRIELKLLEVDAQAQITVSDTGEGIKEEFLPFVFDRFRQADGSTTRLHGGLGLGLAIVRHLVELHGGTVKAESAGEGKGASFIITLPLSVQMPESEQEGEAELQLAVPEAKLEHLADLSGLRVLVVDDEADSLEFLNASLSGCGAEVRAVTSAAEALEQLQEFRPDVLISDIGMPHEDGYALMRKVRALGTEHGGAIPAAAVTAYARSEDRLRALLAGFQTHIAKPVEPAELAAVVASLAGRTTNE